MHIGYLVLAILIGWVYASLTEKPSTGAKVIGPWDMSELIRHGLCVGGAVLGVIILVIFTNASKTFDIGDNGKTDESTVFLLSEVSGIAIGSIMGAVLASDIWRVVGGMIGGSKPPSGGGM